MISSTVKYRLSSQVEGWHFFSRIFSFTYDTSCRLPCPIRTVYARPICHFYTCILYIISVSHRRRQLLLFSSLSFYLFIEKLFKQFPMKICKTFSVVQFFSIASHALFSFAHFSPHYICIYTLLNRHKIINFPSS